MSDLAPLPVADLDTSRRTQHRRALFQQLHRHHQQRQRATAVFGAAARSQNTYVSDLGRFAQIGAWRAGIDGRDFFRRPEWYQSQIEDYQPEPDRRRFIGRMWDRVNDGARISQMGDIGWRAYTGRIPLDQAIEATDQIRNQMSDLEWLANQKGVGAWIERNLGQGLEIVGQQAALTKDAVSLAVLWAAAGAAVGSAAPGLGTAAGGAGGFGTGMWVGMGRENVEMMIGLEYLDLSQMQVTLPDGTKAPMPQDVAKLVAGTVGAVNGVIELISLTMLGPTGIGLQRGLQRASDRVLRRMMADGTLKAVATRAAVKALTTGGLELGQEIMQEVASEIGSHVAVGIAEDMPPGQRVDRQQLGRDILVRVNELMSVGAGIAMLGLPGAGISAFRDARGRRQVADNPDRLFDRSIDGRMVPIEELTVRDTVSTRQRMLAEDVVRMAAVTGGLPPIGVVQDASGMSVATPDDQAVVQVLRNYGFRQVRVGAEPDVVTEPGAQPAPPEPTEPTTAAPGETEPPGVELDESAAPRDIDVFDELRQQIRDQAPEDVTDEQVNTAAILVQNVASQAGMSLREYLDRALLSGREAVDPELARQILAGRVPREQAAEPQEEPPDEAPETAAEAEPVERTPGRVEIEPVVDEPPVDAEPEDGAEAEPATEEEPETPEPPSGTEDEEAADRPETDSGPARPKEGQAGAGFIQVDPIRLTIPEDGDIDDAAIVAWEAADGTLQVLAGHARAGLATRMRETGGDPFTVPVLRLREADGVTLEEAKERTPFLSDQTKNTVLDTARFLRGLPVHRLFRDIQMNESRLRTVLGLAALSDEVFGMAERGEIDPYHARWIGVVMPDDHASQGVVAVAFVEFPPNSYTAEWRARLYKWNPTTIGELEQNRAKAEIMFRAMLKSPKLLQEKSAALAQRGQVLHDSATRQHLSAQQILGRAIGYWSLLDVAEDMVNTLAVGAVGRGEQELNSAAEALVQHLVENADRLVPKIEPETGRPAPPPPKPEPEPEPVTPEPATPEPVGEQWKPSRRRIVMDITAGTSLYLIDRNGTPWWSDAGGVFQGDPPAYLKDEARNPAPMPPRADRAMQTQPGEDLGTPVMSYDTSPDTPNATRVPVDVFRRADGTELHVDARYIAFAARRYGRATFHALPNDAEMIGVRAQGEWKAAIAHRKVAPEGYRDNVRHYGVVAEPAPRTEPEPPAAEPEPTPEPEAPTEAEGPPLAAAASLARRGRKVTEWGSKMAADVAQRLKPGDKIHVKTKGGKEWLTGFVEIVRITGGQAWVRDDGTKQDLPAEEAPEPAAAEEGPPARPAPAPEGERFRVVPVEPTRYRMGGWRVVDSEGSPTKGTFHESQITADAEARAKNRRERAPDPLSPENALEEERARMNAAFEQRIASRGRQPKRAPKPKPPAAKPPENADAAGLPAEPKKAAPRIESASLDDVMDGIAEIKGGGDPDIVFQDGPVWGDKELRLIKRLIWILMWEQGLHRFDQFASTVMEKWGGREHRAAVHADLREWYEVARDARPSWLGEMSAPAEIDDWYRANPEGEPSGRDTGDELQRPVPDRAEGETPERVPADAGRPDTEPAPAGDRDVGAGDGDDAGGAEPDAARPDDRPRDRDERPRGDSRRPAAPIAKEVPSTSNFAFARGELTETERRGPAQKAKENIAAITLLKEIQAEGREAATADEQRILAKYVGWGGLKPAFPAPRTGAFGKGFEAAGQQLQELLTPDEYATAQRSIQYAHYTSEQVITAMWGAAVDLGFQGGKVLEPGMGVGHFAGLFPPPLAARSGYFGVEMDHVTAGIAKLLYPNWTVREQDFTKTAVPPNLFDLAIGNPPFADIRPADRRYDKFGFMLHDYFFAKSIDSVKPGGLLLFVTSAGTMNKTDKKARNYLGERADFLGGVRLPNIAFKRNAMTEVTTDILVFRRRGDRQPANHVAPWQDTVELELEDRKGELRKGKVNEYFVAHPRQIVGRQGFYDQLTAQPRYGVQPTAEMNADNLGRFIDEAIARLVESAPRAEAVAPEPTAAEQQQAVEDALEDGFEITEKKDGSFVVAESGELFQYRHGTLTEPTRPGSQGKTPKLTKAQVELVKQLVPVRDALREVLTADVADDVPVGDAARRKLNETYDSFVAEHGPIGKWVETTRKPTIVDQERFRRRRREEARAAGVVWEEGSFDDRPMLLQKPKAAKMGEIARARQQAREAAGSAFDEGSFDPSETPPVVQRKYPNLVAFMGDPESYRLAALEEDFDPNTNSAVKSAVFETNVIRRQPEAQIESAEDAMIHVLATTGRFDIGVAAASWGKSTTETVEALGDLIYFDPRADDWVTAEEYLSGNVVRKLEEAIAAERGSTRYTRNVEALRAVQPKPVPPAQIDVQVGDNWLPINIMEAFATEEIGLQKRRIGHSAQLGQWNIPVVHGGDDAADARYGAHYVTGTLMYPASKVLMHAANSRSLRAPLLDLGDGKKARDEEGDKRATEAVIRVQDAFQAWVWKDEARTELLAKIYNDQFNVEVDRQYRTDYVTTPGAAEWFKWHAHQLRGIARILMNGNTYLAHAVGAGKTATMIGSAMESIRLGLAKKPLFVVPNHMLMQFTREWLQLYPTARLLVADDMRFHGTRRKQFVADAAAGDYHAVIMTFSSFQLIPMSDEFVAQFTATKIQEFTNAIATTEDRWTRGKLEQAKQRLEEKIAKKTGKGRKDQVLTFEEMGIDMLYIDEGHEYRKLDFATTRNMKGIDPVGADKSWDTYMKTRYIESINPGRGLVMASGTPITNTLAELWTVQRYMDEDHLREINQQSFDSWAGTFGAEKTELERSVTGEYQYTTRFDGIRNAADLSKIVRRFMDVLTPAQLRDVVVVPAIKGGDREQVLVDLNPAQAEYQDRLYRRADLIKRRAVEPTADNYPLLITHGRLSATDMRILGGHLDVREQTKLEVMIDKVFQIWKETTNHPFYEVENGRYRDEPSFYGPATQMVFASLGFKRADDRISIHTYMTQALVAMGVPEHEIRYMGDYEAYDAKQRLFNDMNEGVARILIGSEKNMGTGVNAQKRLYTSHNLMPVWHPSDDEQRVGRPLRQGNMNREVRIIDYSTVGSYDTAMWGLMRRKASTIEEFFRGDPNLRFVEEFGEASQYAKVAAMTTDDPRVLELAEVKRDLDAAEREMNAAEERRWNARSAARNLRDSIEHAERLIGLIGQDIETRQDTVGDKFTIELDGETYTERSAAAEQLQKYVSEAEKYASVHRDIGHFAGFPMRLHIAEGLVGTTTAFYNEIVLMRAGDRAVGPKLYNNSGPGVLRGLEAQLRGLEGELAKQEGAIAHHRENLARVDADADAAPPDRAKVEMLRVRQRELEAALAPAPEPAPIAEGQPAPAPEAPPEAPPEILTQRDDGTITADLAEWDPAIGRWRLRPDVAEALRIEDRTWATAVQAAADIDAARGRRQAAGEQLTEGELGDWLTEQLVEQYGVTDNPEAAEYVLWDGRLLRKPQDERQGGPNPGAMMMATDAVRVQGKRIQAEGPLSDRQIAAVLAMTDEDPGYALLLSHRGQRVASMMTDRALNTETLRVFFSRSPAPDPTTARGAVLFNEANQAVIALSEAADFDTLIEELAHVFRRHQNAEQEAVTGEWSGATRSDDGTWEWSREAEEKFARGVVQYLREDASPNDAMKSVFTRIAEWLKNLYVGLRLHLTPEVRRAFEDMLIDRSSPEVHAFERVKAMMGNRSKMTFADPDGRKLTVQQDGAGWVVDVLDDDNQRVARRTYDELDDALRDVSGVRTPTQIAPFGNARMAAGGASAEMIPEDAELTLETDDVTIGEVVEAVGVEDDERPPARGERLLRQDDREAGRREARRAAMEVTGAEARPQEVPIRSAPVSASAPQTETQLRADVREARAEATATTARVYTRQAQLRYASLRIGRIHQDLVRVLRDSKTLPEPFRSHLRQLAEDLDLRKRGRASVRRMEPGETGETDPLRLMAVLDEILEGQQHPGTLSEFGATPFAQMKLVDLERLHRKVMAAVAFVRDMQTMKRKEGRAARARTAGDVIDELRARKEAVKLPEPFRTLHEFLGISSERPEYLLERLGGGMRSVLYKTVFDDVEEGIQDERALGQDVRKRFNQALHSAGITETWSKFEVWMNERMPTPDAVKHIKTNWTRGEVMSFAMLWQDPYARRMLSTPDRIDDDGNVIPGGGMVVYDDVLSRRPRQGTEKHVITDEMADALIGLLSDRAKRLILGDSAPVRLLFNELFQQMNAVFRRLHGYDLERWPFYYPVHIAEFAIPREQQMEGGGALDFLQRDAGAAAGPHKGMIQFRVRAMLPIALHALGPEVNRAVSHSAAYVGLEEPLMAARALVWNPRVEAELRKAGGDGTPDYLKRYLQGVAHRYVGDDKMLDWLNAVRQNVSVATLGIDPKIAVSQALSLPLYAMHVPTKYLMQAIVSTANPAEERRIRARHRAYDPNFAMRGDVGFDPDLRTRQVGQHTLPSSRRGWRRKHERMLSLSMKMLQGVDLWTVTRGHQAAVLHAMDALSTGTVSRKMAEALQLDDIEAVRNLPAEDRLRIAYKWARWVTRRTQPSFFAEALSDLARRPVARLWTSFSGYTNVAQNALIGSYRDLFKYGIRDREAFRAAMVSTMTIVFFGGLGMTLLNYLRNLVFGREPRDESWLMRLVNGVIDAFMTLWFGVRDARYLVAHGGRSMENPTMEAITNVAAQSGAIYRALVAGDEDRLLRSMDRFIGDATKLIGMPYWTARRYVGGVIQHIED